MPSLDGILFLTIGLLRIEQIVIGPVAKRYGPFRLHTVTLALKGGRTVKWTRYFIVVGDLAVPLSLNYRTGSDDPQGYTSVITRRGGPFRECVNVSEIPIRRSTERDLHDHVDRWLKNKRIGIDCYVEQLPAASNPSMGNARWADFYRQIIAEMEEEHRIVGDAFRMLLQEYPDAAVGTKHNAATDAREARRARRISRATIWGINKLLK